MNKWLIRGLTAVGAGVVGTYLVMSEGKAPPRRGSKKGSPKKYQVEKRDKKGEEDASWTERVKQAGVNVKKNVEEQVNNPNIQDRLRNLSSWVEGPGSPGYERDEPTKSDEHSEGDSAD